MPLEKITSFLTYNYLAQKFLRIFLIFFFREIFWKFKNLILKTKIKLTFNKKYKLGWSIIFLTTELTKKNLKNVFLYQKKFKNTKHEIIIICDHLKFRKVKEKIKIINLNSSNFTLGFKRNLGISKCNYKNIVMTLDYTSPIKINLKQLNKEIKKNDIICPKLLTLDNKRYLDWMFLDYPNIGKSFAPYNSDSLKYMYFHGTSYVFKKKFIVKNLFSNLLDNKEGEDISWSLKIRNFCNAVPSKNIILRVKRRALENSVLNNKSFKQNNNKLKYIQTIKYENQKKKILR